MYLLTNKHLEDKHAHRPPVTLSPIKAISALRLQHLRRDVVRGSNSSVTVHHASLQRKLRNQYPTKPQHRGLGTVLGRNSVFFFLRENIPWGVSNACDHRCITSQTLLQPFPNKSSMLKQQLLNPFVTSKYRAEQFQNNFCEPFYTLSCKFGQHHVNWKYVDKS